MRIQSRPVSVRDPRYDPRQANPRSGAHPVSPGPARRGPGGSGPGGSRLPAILAALGVFALVLIVGLGFGGGFLSGGRGGQGPTHPGRSPATPGLMNPPSPADRPLRPTPRAPRP